MPRINTPQRVREARHQLGLSTRGLADLLRLGKDGGRTVRRWESGQSHITGPVQVALECLLYGDPQMASKRSSGDVFADVGFEEFEAEELAVKADLISMIALTIERRNLKQKDAAKICGTHQTSISKILSGKLDSVTIDQLAKWIIALGGSVEISASSPPATSVKKRGSLSFHATS